MECKELLVQWLNNAYAMENAMLEIMQNHAEIAEGTSRERLQHHIDETRHQAERAKMEIQRLGGEIVNPDAEKMTLIDAMIMMSNQGSPDKIVKAAIMDYAIEQLEIADYTAIIRLADKCGEQETVEAMQETLREENEMKKPKRYCR